MNEAGWARLMDKIRENNVVPIIGSRLLVEADGQTSLLAQVATRLITDHGKKPEEIALPPFREINEVASQLKEKIDPVDLCDDVRRAIHAVTNAKDFRIPEPIAQLAAIASFRLFVTLTPDDLLIRCLARRRCPVNEIVHSLDPVERKGNDLPSDWQTRHGEVNVLYLFGKAHADSTFAIHDEDALEYAHKVITDGPLTLKNILGVLHGKSLLLIGCNFPEWLSRFFLRALNRSRLGEKYRRSWLIELKPEQSFTCFLSSYGTGTEVLSDLSPVEFVAELYRRWMNEHGAVAEEPEPRTDESVPRGTMFFISYSRKTDFPHAKSLYESLIKLGVTENEVWFDRHSIEPGQDFRRRILDGIDGCRYFLPLLSRAANNREKAFVFSEWAEATKCRSDVNGHDFIFPVIVDADFSPKDYTDNTSVWTWQREFSLDFSHAPNGLPDERLENKLRKLVNVIRQKSKPS